MQKKHNSITNTLELRLFCTKPWMFLSASCLDERVLQGCLKFYENHLDKPGSKVEFEHFFTEKGGKNGRTGRIRKGKLA